MKILVEALETYKKNNIRDNELGRVLEPGERFEVTEKRLKVLLGNNTHNQAFVKVVEEVETNEDEVTEEVVQSVAEAIVEQAKEDNTTVETVVEQIIEESKIETKKKAKNTK